MANISISFDTEKKLLEVTIEGKKIKNVVEACCYAYDKDGHGSIDVTTTEKVEELDLWKYVRISAVQDKKMEARNEMSEAIKKVISGSL